MSKTTVASTGIDLSDTFAFTGTVTGTPSNLVLIKTITISDDTSISFVNGANNVVLDNTYKVYKIIGTGIRVSEQDAVDMRFGVSVDSGSNYNVTKRGQGIKNNRGASDNNYSNTIYGHTGVTANYSFLNSLDGNEALNQANFEMTIFDPSSTVTYKFMRVQGSFRRTGGYTEMSDVVIQSETTSAINAIRIDLASSNMDLGTMSLYGVKS